MRRSFFSIFFSASSSSVMVAKARNTFFKSTLYLVAGGAAAALARGSDALLYMAGSASLSLDSSGDVRSASDALEYSPTMSQPFTNVQLTRETRGSLSSLAGVLETAPVKLAPVPEGFVPPLAPLFLGHCGSECQWPICPHAAQRDFFLRSLGSRHSLRCFPFPPPFEEDGPSE